MAYGKRQFRGQIAKDGGTVNTNVKCKKNKKNLT